MNRWAAGLLIGGGVGVVASLVVLLLRGEKSQRFLRERMQQLRGALPEPEQVQQYAQQVAGRVSQAAGGVKDTAQQAMKKVKNGASDMSDKVNGLTPVGK
jgi:gas vesicle protein